MTDEQTKESLKEIWIRIHKLTTKAVNNYANFSMADFDEQLGLKRKVKVIQKNCQHKMKDGFCTVCNVCEWD